MSCRQLHPHCCRRKLRQHPPKGGEEFLLFYFITMGRFGSKASYKGLRRFCPTLKTKFKLLAMHNNIFSFHE